MFYFFQMVNSAYRTESVSCGFPPHPTFRKIEVINKIASIVYVAWRYIYYQGAFLRKEEFICQSFHLELEIADVSIKIFILEFHFILTEDRNIVIVTFVCTINKLSSMLNVHKENLWKFKDESRSLK